MNNLMVKYHPILIIACFVGSCIAAGFDKIFLSLILFSGCFLFSMWSPPLEKVVASFCGIKMELTKAAQEARYATKELKKFISLATILLLSSVQREGRSASYSYSEKEKLKCKLMNLMEKFGFNEMKRVEMLNNSDWHKYVEFDYIQKILGNRPKESKLLNTWMELYNNPSQITPVKLREFESDFNFNPELLLDYEYYLY